MKRIIIAIAIVTTIFGCQNTEKKEEFAQIKSSEVIIAPEPSPEALADKIIKTADMRFRVKDVQLTKENLSKTIKAQGGTVAEFSIQSIIKETDKVKQSADSLKEITAYQTEGFLVAKVPSEKLDDFTNSIAKMAVFIDSQAMKLDDQSIAYLTNKLKADNRLDAATSINKLATKKGSNVETSLKIKDDYVDRKMENLSIDSRVKYSTITLNFYQDNTIKTMIVPNDRIYDYKPGFGDRLWLNMVYGWTIFKEIILAIANLWIFAVLGITVFFIARYFVRKNKIAMNLATQNYINQNKV